MSKSKIFLVCLLISTSSRSQTAFYQDPLSALPEQINSYLSSAAAADKFNGVALVAKNGMQVFHKAFGWRDFESGSYNDTLTIFPILSITKSFTAIVILMLQEQKKLSVKDRLSKYLPGFPNAEEITIEQLITHTSGIHNFTDDIGEEDSALVNHPVTKQFMLDYIANKPFDYSPGKGFAYNNSAYYLAGIVIEKATGRSYEENVRELIFKPLDMQRSGFDFNHLPATMKAKGYQVFNSSEQKPYTYVDSTVGYSAGSIYSTSTDMYKWGQAIASGQLLSAASWKYAFKRQASDYGFGFRINHFFGNDYIKHSGGYPGFVSEFIYYPKQAVTIILLKNTGNYGEDLWPVTMGLSSIMLGLPYDNWKPRTPINLPDDALKDKEGEYASGKVSIRFRVKDKQLYEILSNGTELPLLAESGDFFYLQNFNCTVHFKKNQQQQVEKVIIHEHGKDHELKKLR